MVTPTTSLGSMSEVNWSRESWNDAARQRLRQRGLADAGNVLDQQVAARQQAGERKAHHFRLSANRLAQRRLDFRELGERNGRASTVSR